MDFEQLGFEFKKRREAIGFTQEHVAKVNGMSRATVSQLENGRLAELGMRKFIALCSTVGLVVILKQEQSRPSLRDLIEENKHA